MAVMVAVAIISLLSAHWLSASAFDCLGDQQHASFEAPTIDALAIDQQLDHEHSHDIGAYLIGFARPINILGHTYEQEVSVAPAMDCLRSFEPPPRQLALS